MDDKPKQHPKAAEVKIKTMILGTTVCKFELPMIFVDDINEAYDKAKDLPAHNDDLAGKIKDEFLVNDILTDKMRGTFFGCFKQYLHQAQKPFWHCSLENAWINEMKAGEYNPLHYHASKVTDLGLSSILMLKRPESYGEEITRKDSPSNGWLELTGGQQDPISISQMRIDAKVGEFYVFPYTMLHGVYPFTGPGIRRTLSYNCNLYKDAVVRQQMDKKIAEADKNVKK